MEPKSKLIFCNCNLCSYIQGKTADQYPTSVYFNPIP